MPSNSLPQPIALSPAMSRRATRLWRALGRLGFIAESGILVAVVAAVWLILAPLGYAQAGTAGLAAAAVAAGVSLFAAQLALAIGHLFRGPAAPMWGMVMGMFARMSVALLVGVALQRGVPALGDAAMILYLLVFYLVTLFVETAMLVAKIRPDSVRPSAPLPKAV